MMGKHQKTFTAIFANPVRTNVRWRDIEALMIHCGAQVIEAEGSRVLVSLNGVRAVFHRPHPKPDTDKGQLKSVRAFLTEAGVRL